MKTNIKLWTMGLMTAALLGNTACTDLLHESYGQVVSEDYVPKTEEDVSYPQMPLIYLGVKRCCNGTEWFVHRNCVRIKMFFLPVMVLDG